MVQLVGCVEVMVRYGRCWITLLRTRNFRKYPAQCWHDVIIWGLGLKCMGP